MVLHRKVEKVVLQLKTEGTIFFIVVMSNRKEWDGRTLFAAWDFHDSLQEFDFEIVFRSTVRVKCFSKFCK